MTSANLKIVAPMYAGGVIEGDGNTLRPSIEQGVMRFADEISIQVFLGPEKGLTSNEIYQTASPPAAVRSCGCKSSLPLHAGWKNARSYVPGYCRLV